MFYTPLNCPGLEDYVRIILPQGEDLSGLDYEPESLSIVDASLDFKINIGAQPPWRFYLLKTAACSAMRYPGFVDAEDKRIIATVAVLQESSMKKEAEDLKKLEAYLADYIDVPTSVDGKNFGRIREFCRRCEKYFLEYIKGDDRKILRG